MSEENTIDFRAFVESVRKPDRRDPTKANYSQSWKDFCLKIVLAYQEHMQGTKGFKRFRWSETRDAIMEDFDVSSGRKLAGRDTRLTRDHLEYWNKSGKIEDQRFDFVDRFIRKLDKPFINSLVTSKVREGYFRDRANSFIDIYQSKDVNPQEAGFLEILSGRFLYSSSLTDTSFKQFVMRIDFAERSIIKVTASYPLFDIRSENPSDFWRGGLFYDGYLIPLPDFRELEAIDPQNLFARRATLKSYPCLLLLFRPEFQGHSVNGHVSAKIEFRFTKAGLKGVHLSEVFSAEPNILLSPFGYPVCGDRRYVQKPDVDLQPLKLSANQQHSEFLARFFDECYKGYLF